MFYDMENNILDVFINDYKYSFYVLEHNLYINEKQLTFNVIVNGDCAYNLRLK